VVNRDYIHIMDLADAHWRAIQYLQAGGQTAAFNLGNGGGYSVMQVIEAAEAVTGKSVPVQVGPRRAGDPARLVADATRARSVLGWQPQYAELETIVRHAWGWEQKAGC
jgi:UDP-glucose 4-epimerase